MDNPESNQQNVTKKKRKRIPHCRGKKTPVNKIQFNNIDISTKIQLPKLPGILGNSEHIDSITNFLYELTTSQRNRSKNVKTNYRVFLKKAKALILDKQEKHPRKILHWKNNDLLDLIEDILSPKEDYKQMFTYTMKKITQLTSAFGYKELYQKVTQANSSSSSSSSSDDDNYNDIDYKDDHPSSSYAAKINNNLSSQQSNTSQSNRKRRASVSAVSLSNILNQDPDIGYEPPLAKRQQRVPSIYQNQPNSVASSLHPSSIDEILIHEIETKSSSSDNDSEREVVTAKVVSEIDSDDAAMFERPDSSDLDTEDETSTPEHGSNHNCSTHYCERAVTSSDDSVSQKSSPYPSQFRRTESVCGEHTPASCLLQEDSNTIDSTEQQKIPPFDDYGNSIFDCMTPAAETDPPRQCPLPALAWANAQDVWHTMCKRDEVDTCLRDAAMLERHPGLQPRMRAILLDWLIEVCEVYKLHRETYYLAVDYLDRFLTSKSKVQKTHLQLIGITCLFVAAKVEEIYPPKIGEFAYVTDGACREQDILHNEILLLQALDWDINPVTPMGWLGVYMQLNANNRTPKTLPPKNLTQQKENVPNATVNTKQCVDEGFIYPQFSGFEFVQTAQLLDLCSLDVGVAHFPYSVLAAAAMSHTFNKETALRCSGLDWQTIQPCARWMEPFFIVISSESDNLFMIEQNEQVPSKFGLGHICSTITTDDSHIIQTHTITMNMFDRVTTMQEQLLCMTKINKPEASPAIGLICPEGLLTPPASSRKPLDLLDEDHTKTTVKSIVPTTIKTMPVNNGSSSSSSSSQPHQKSTTTTAHNTTIVVDNKQKTT